MTMNSGEDDLEAQVEVLRQHLAGAMITLGKVNQGLDELTDKVHSRGQVDNVVAFDLPPRSSGRHRRDMLLDFLD